MEDDFKWLDALPVLHVRWVCRWVVWKKGKGEEQGSLEEGWEADAKHDRVAGLGFCFAWKRAC